MLHKVFVNALYEFKRSKSDRSGAELVVKPPKGSFPVKMLHVNDADIRKTPMDRLKGDRCRYRQNPLKCIQKRQNSGYKKP
jgi:hypothetical protein